MRLVKFGIQFKCNLKLAVRRRVILPQGQRNSARGVCLGAAWVERERPLTRRVGRLEVGVAAVPIHIKERATIGDAGVGARETWIEFDRAIKHAARILQGGAAGLVLYLAAAKIVFVSLNVFGRRFFQRAFLVL